MQTDGAFQGRAGRAHVGALPVSRWIIIALLLAGYIVLGSFMDQIAILVLTVPIVLPLIKSLDLPGGQGQHFFFDAGNGDCVAFFWFAGAPDRVPGISSPGAIPVRAASHKCLLPGSDRVLSSLACIRTDRPPPCP